MNRALYLPATLRVLGFLVVTGGNPTDLVAGAVAALAASWASLPSPTATDMA